MRIARLLMNAALFSTVLLLNVMMTLSPAAAAAPAIKPGDYRLAFATPIGDLPFNITLEQKSGVWTATFINGLERVQAETTKVVGDTLTLNFPSYNSSLTGSVNAVGVFAGKVTFTRSTGPVDLPVTGKFGDRHRFFADQAKAGVNLAGRWALTTTSADGKTTRAGLFELTQTGNIVDGTALFVNADNRFLHGEVRDGALSLSTFDGGQGSLWVGKVATDGTLSGQSWSPLLNATSTWTAKRDATAKLDDAYGLTYLKPGYDRFAFTFPNLEGKPVSLSDARYKGKVTVVTIAGSWCPTCHDEAAFLAPFYEKNKDRGFEAVALMYEYSPKPEVAAVSARNFAKRYGVKYQQLLAGTADKAAASATLPMINAVLVYPTMIIVDRQGQVRKIHTGFPGPATGVHHEAFKKEFIALIDSLLAEGA